MPDTIVRRLEGDEKLEVMYSLDGTRCTPRRR